MDVTRGTSAVVAFAVGVASLAVASRLSASPHDYVVVETQLQPGRSTVVDASGVFSACTQVEETEATASVDGPIRFTGEKRFSCAGGTRLLVEYDVGFDPGTGTTAGTWQALVSTLPGVEEGDGGGLVGDPGACTGPVHADGCIVDRLTLAD